MQLATLLVVAVALRLLSALRLAHCTADLVRIDAATNATYIRRVPCALEPNANLHAFATPGRKSWRDPPHASLCCVPKQGCFRAVLDGAVDLSPGTAGIRLEEKVLAVLKTELGVNEFVRFDTGRYKEYTAGDSGVYNDARLLRAGRKMTMAECELWAVGHDDRGCRPHQWSAMHADYFESASYVVSAVLFMGEEDDDEDKRVGGWTGIADELAADKYTGEVTLVSGVLVEPKKARLMLFTGGGENYHGPLPVLRGRRSTFHAWFKCDCVARLQEHTTNAEEL